MPTLTEPGTRINVRLPDDLLRLIDRAASRESMTRTAWLIQSALHHLPPDLIREWENAHP